MMAFVFFSLFFLSSDIINIGTVCGLPCLFCLFHEGLSTWTVSEQWSFVDSQLGNGGLLGQQWSSLVHSVLRVWMKSLLVCSHLRYVTDASHCFMLVTTFRITAMHIILGVWWSMMCITVVLKGSQTYPPRTRKPPTRTSHTQDKCVRCISHGYIYIYSAWGVSASSILALLPVKTSSFMRAMKGSPAFAFTCRPDLSCLVGSAPRWRMCRWWILCTFYLLACHMRPAVGHWGLCCCVHVTSLERWLSPLFADSA